MVAVILFFPSASILGLHTDNASKDGTRAEPGSCSPTHCPGRVGWKGSPSEHHECWSQPGACRQHGASSTLHSEQGEGLSLRALPENPSTFLEKQRVETGLNLALVLPAPMVKHQLL